MRKSNIFIYLAMLILVASCVKEDTLDKALGKKSGGGADIIVGSQAFSFVPSSYDFGQIANGGHDFKLFTITNTSAGQVYISSITASAGAFTLNSHNCPLSPASLAKNASCSATIDFDPTTFGDQQGILSISFGINVTSDSKYSASASMEGESMPPLVFSGLNSIDTVTATSMRLNWFDAIGEISYKIYMIDGFGNQIFIGGAPSNATSYIVNSLSPGTSYKFRVRGVDANSIEDANMVDISQATDAPGTFNAITGFSVNENATNTSAALVCSDGANTPVFNITNQTDADANCSIGAGPVATCTPNYKVGHSNWSSNIDVTCSINGLNIVNTFTLSVTDVNQPPVLTNMTNLSCDTKSACGSWNANDGGDDQDADGDTLLYSCEFVGGNFLVPTNCTSLPADSFSFGTSTGVINFTPSLAAAVNGLQTIYTVTITGDDQQGIPLTDSDSFDYIVNPTIPVLNAITSLSYPGGAVKVGSAMPTVDINNITGGNSNDDSITSYTCKYDKVIDSSVLSIDNCGGYLAEVLSLNPIGYFRLDEVSGNVLDTSTSGAIGIPNGTPVYSSNGPITSGGLNKSVDFNSDFFSFGNYFSFEYNEPFSMGAWIKTTSNNSQIIMVHQDETLNYQGYNMFIDSNGYIRFLFRDSIPTELYKRTTVALDDGIWHFVVITYDGSLNIANLKMYVDGSEAATAVLGSSLNGANTTVPTGKSFGIGDRPIGASADFIGNIDEVMIFDKVLTATEINNLYTSATSSLNNLSGNVEFNPTTGQLDWTPGPGSYGNYEIKITATNDAGSTDEIFTVAVQQDYETSKLIGDYNADFVDYIGPASNPTIPWRDLSSGGNDGTLNGVASNSWTGTGVAGNLYRLIFNGAGSVDYGPILSGQTKLGISSWFSSLNPTQEKGTLFSNGNSGSNDGFTLMQDRYSDGIGLMFGQYNTDYASIVLADNPRHYWKLNDVSGTFVDSGTAGTAPGTQTGGVSYNLPGPIFGENSKAAGFDGANDKITFGAIGSDPITTMTAEAWFYADRTSTNGRIGILGSWVGGQRTFLLYCYSGHTRAVFSADGTASSLLLQGSSLKLNDWNHIGITYNSANGDAELFHNGELVATGSIGSSTPLTNTSYPHSAGHWTSSYGKGRIAHIAYYETIKPASMFKNHYQKGRPDLIPNNNVAKFPASAVMQDNPVAYWRLGENSGDTIYDYSGYGNNGKIKGGVTLLQPGGLSPINDPDFAASFDGNPNTGVEIPLDSNNTKLHFNDDDGFSIEARIKLNANNITQYIVSQYAGAATGGMIFYIANTGDLRLWTSNGGGTFWCGAGTSLATGLWYHVAAVFNRYSISLYVNGQFMAKCDSVNGYNIVASPNPTMAIGMNPNDNTLANVNGVIDEVAIYDKALTIDRIKAHYNEASYNYCTSPIDLAVNDTVNYSMTFDGVESRLYKGNRLECAMRPGISYDDSIDLISGMNTDSSDGLIANMFHTMIYGTSDNSTALDAAGVDKNYYATVDKYKGLPTKFSGLKLWLRADALTTAVDGDYISTWNDLSENSNDALNTVSNTVRPRFAKRAANGQPALYFDGDDYLRIPDVIVGGSTNRTVFIVQRPEVISSTTSFMSMGDVSNGNGGRFQITSEYGMRCSSCNRIFNQPGDLNKIDILSMNLNGTLASNLSAFKNGLLLGVSSTTDLTLNTNGNTYIGSDNTSDAPTSLYNGFLSEIIVFEGSLSASDQEAVECYLADKYNITLSHTCN